MLSILLPSRREPEIQAFVQEIESKIPAHEIIVSSDRDGRGKGWAVREALSVASGDQIAFLDGDGDISPRMLLRLLPFLQDFDAVVGTKRITHKSAKRRVVTYLSRIYIRIFFGLNVDTQTGIKLFRRQMLEPWKTDGYLYDVEVLARIKKRGGRIIEVPIEAEITEKIEWRTIWKTFLESLHLKFLLLSPVKR